MWKRVVGQMSIGAAALLLVSACTATSSGAGPVREAGAATSVPTTGCVPTAGLSDARDGVISAGPFKENVGRWLDGTKFWVATSVDQAQTSATIRATSIDGPAQVVTQKRDSTAVRDGNPPGLFFPGELQLPDEGSWKIDVTIGGDVGCFLVDA